MAQLIARGRVVRGWLGIVIQDLTAGARRAASASSRASGVLVSDVMKDGPAEAAGLQAGDIIVEFGGRADQGGDRPPAAGRRRGAGPAESASRSSATSGRTPLTVKIGEQPGEETVVAAAARARSCRAQRRAAHAGGRASASASPPRAGVLVTRGARRAARARRPASGPATPSSRSTASPSPASSSSAKSWPRSSRARSCPGVPAARRRAATSMSSSSRPSRSAERAPVSSIAAHATRRGPSCSSSTTSPGVRESVREILKGDCEVLEAEDGAAGLELVRSRRVDVAMLDVRMPGERGPVVLPRILGARRPIAVILMTAVPRRAHGGGAPSRRARTTTSPSPSTWTRSSSWCGRPRRSARSSARCRYLRGRARPRARLRRPGGPPPRDGAPLRADRPGRARRTPRC